MGKLRLAPFPPADAQGRRLRREIRPHGHGSPHSEDHRMHTPPGPGSTGLAACLLLAALARPAIAEADDKKALVAEKLPICAACHGPDGNSVIPQNPRLAALDKKYIERQLLDFKRGARKSEVMEGIAATLGEKDIKALADYFSDQVPAKGAPADPALVAAGKSIYDDGIVASAVPACAGCHNDDGSGDGNFPRLAGQHPAYVVEQMLRYKSGARANDRKSVMRAVAQRMSESEIRAVAEYAATLTGVKP
jgi:cytochrome c553